MPGRPRRGSTARSAALIALGTLAVHQLRYVIAYGSAAHEQLLRQGHAYLFGALPILVSFSVAALAAGLLWAALGRARAGSPVASPAPRALLYAVAIVAVFAVQESVEGGLSAAHASGLAAVFAAGGWWAIPLALCFGGLCAVLDGGLAKLESRLAGPDAPRPARRSPAAATPSTRLAVPLASLPLAFGLARRPPPRVA
jgi:hypothetical protein